MAKTGRPPVISPGDYADLREVVRGEPQATQPGHLLAAQHRRCVRIAHPDGRLSNDSTKGPCGKRSRSRSDLGKAFVQRISDREQGQEAAHVEHLAHHVAQAYQHQLALAGAQLLARE